MKIVDLLKPVVRASSRYQLRVLNELVQHKLDEVVVGLDNQSRLFHDKLEKVVAGVDNQARLLNDKLSILIDLQKAQIAAIDDLTAALAEPGRQLRSQDFVQEIQRLGIHPFILVGLGQNSTADRFIACTTQNDAPAFVHRLAALPRFADSLLLRGIERALQQEIYDAGDLLYRWTRGDGALAETVQVLKADVQGRYNYPVFAFDAGSAPSGQERADALLAMLETYARCDGNDALRFSLMEAAALALGRAFGARGNFRQALAAVDKGLAVKPYSIHLKAAKHTLLLKSEGKEVPPRLEKFAGEDNGYLRQFVCPLPFERFDIGPNGDVLVCCGHWLPTTIGNFMNQSVEDILNSPTALAIRQSVADGSYKYCNHLECGTMAQDALPRREELDRPRTRKAVAEKNYRLDGVDQLMFAFDQTCNLACPSCRTHVITEKVSQSLEKARAVEEKLLPLLPSVRTLHINPAGELFGSKPSRKLLEMINDERCPELRLDIISNGTLFSREEWNKFPGIHNKVRSVRISIDAACKETFEKLRRLGKYDVFLKNMRFLRELRLSGTLPQLKFSFTYQLDNFREMKAFVAFCDEMHADFAIFERLQNIAFTEDEYRRKAVHHPEHPLYAEFIEVIKDPVFRTKRVWHDFDYDGVDNLSREEARNRISSVEVAVNAPVAGAESTAAL
jgi:tetratricopeptide (TPR) repeat protein